MVKFGQTEPKIIPVAYRNVRRPRSDVEVLRLSQIRKRAGDKHMSQTQRHDFHLFALYLSGRSRPTVDFQPHACGPGSLLHVQPGQVLRWGITDGLEAVVLIFKPGFLLPVPGRGSHREALVNNDWPPSLELRGTAREATEGWLLKLEALYHEVDDGPAATSLLRHLVSVLLLDVARRCNFAEPPSQLSAPDLERVRAFKVDVERSFRVTRRALDYAERLGCSAKTLDRSCEAVLGNTAKGYVDARVLLEAKRLLAHTRLSVAAIAEDLGFTQPTNFNKFFKSRAKVLPGTFRESVDRR